jgi:hypothetical protein
MHDTACKLESQQGTNLSGFSDNMLRDYTLIIFRKKIAAGVGSIMTLFILNYSACSNTELSTYRIANTQTTNTFHEMGDLRTVTAL